MNRFQFLPVLSTVFLCLVFAADYFGVSVPNYITAAALALEFINISVLLVKGLWRRKDKND